MLYICYLLHALDSSLKWVLLFPSCYKEAEAQRVSILPNVTQLVADETSVNLATQFALLTKPCFTSGVTRECKTV
jgi:hypothetical protein